MGILCKKCNETVEDLKIFIENQRFKLFAAQDEAEYNKQRLDEKIKLLTNTQQKLYEERLINGGTMQNSKGWVK